MIIRPDKFDPETLDAALAELVDKAQGARDCFHLGLHDPGLKQFELAIVAISKAVHQISLLNRE